MKPSEYFPQLYLDDLATFGGYGFCGMTMESIFKPKHREEYICVEDFINSVYQLNLMGQGIYTYFPTDFRRWRNIVAKYPDCRCSAFHGGVNTPDSILDYIESQSSFVIESIEIDNNALQLYSKHFFFDYLKELDEKANFRTLTPEGLINRLKRDYDCSRFREFME